VPAERCFIPIKALRALARGSYEHVVAVVEAMVQEQSEKIFGSPVGVRVVGTFPGEVLVLSEDGRVARASFEPDGEGSVRLTGTAPAAVPIYRGDRVREYVREQVSTAVEAWRAGRRAEAAEIIADVAPYVGEGEQKDDWGEVRALLSSIVSDSPWRDLLGARRDAIRAELGAEAVRELESAQLQPRFERLYSGRAPVAVEDHPRFAELVRRGLRALGDRVESLRDLVELSNAELQTVIEFDGFNGGGAALSTLKLFTEDLVGDLCNLHESIVRATTTLSGVDCLGRFHDTIAEGLQDYELAGRFAVTMAQRLREGLNA